MGSGLANGIAVGVNDLWCEHEKRRYETSSAEAVEGALHTIPLPSRFFDSNEPQRCLSFGKIEIEIE
jgi:hypothetical protein